MTAPRAREASRPAADAAAEVDRLCAWLRGALGERLAALRGERDAARAELDALLSPPAGAAAGAPPRPVTLIDLAHRLSLREDEQAIVCVLLAAAVEPGLGRALGLLCDPLGHPAPTWDAIVRLLDLPRTHRIAADDAIARFALLSPGEGGALALDPAIEARLLGRACRDAALVAHLSVIPPRDPLPGWPVDDVVARVERAVSAGARGVRLWLRGPDGSGRRTLLAAVARRLGLVGTALRPGAASPAMLRALVRLAWLDDLAPAIADRTELPSDLPPPVLQGWLGAEPPEPPPPGVVDLAVAMPPLDRAAREATWRRLVPAFAAWPADERAALVDAWAGRPGQLVRVALAGAATTGEASALLAAEATGRLEGHCDVLETPFDWGDLIVPAQLATSLEELAFEARALPALYEDPAVGRLFPHGRSVIALFSGPPGTGKTMAAQVIARAIGLPLFRIDLSRVVSKYIGETSQNLARLLGAARDIDAVVLFDEADALFGRRTEVHDAHDRYANADTDYLLQALDTWPGVAILASNRRGNIDPAFLRRMRVVLEFARPDAGQRRRIWRRLAPVLLPDGAALAAHLDAIADTLELTGAQIKNALLNARLAAARAGAPAAVEHILRGVERELEKDGRGLSARDRKRLADLPASLEPRGRDIP